ncbi:protein NUCLEAR FUSION DEFECTIVE 4 [Mercurialis annua]|uniref:protein NUCLEAR FUSION DEFECTIVE 4 n=1 Tax=Mercurialis annua TaxID=3986 RepID=UPI002160149A|nr:protein NUCLEAR FUSION DEFECTIVE 4 [Mercurialis annua]
MPPSSSTTSARQWLSLVGIIWLQSVNGTNTNFPAYSSQLKHLLSISQLQLNNLAFASDAGKLFGFISGIASFYLPLWLVLLIGATLGLIGYGVQYLFLTSYISFLSYPHIFLLTVLAGNSICWINTVCYVVTIRNFESDRQVAVGLTTSYQGLSAKIYTVVVNALIFLFPPKSSAKTYLLLNSILPLLVSAMAVPIVREFDIIEDRTVMKFGFLAMFVITIGTGVYAVLSSLRASWFSPTGNAIGVMLFLLSPLMIPFAVRIRGWIVAKWVMNREAKVYDFTAEEKMESSVEVDKKDGEKEVNFGVVKEEIGVKIMVRRVDFWLYFGVYLCGATVGFVYLNNLGQIAESRGCLGTSSLVSLSSSFGFFGRLLPSLLDYFFSRRKHLISRPGCIAALMGPMSLSFMLLLNKSNMCLYMSTAIIGVCTGAITSISVSTTTDLFGTKHFSINHNVLVANIPIGSFIFGSLAAILYHNQGNGDDGKCIGAQCYKNTFIIWASLCFFGTFLSLILYARTRKFYSQKS